MNVLALRAAILVAAVYGYFLLFAQFAFVALLRAGGIGISGEKTVLGTMALAGIVGGFLVAARGAGSMWIRVSLACAAAMAGLSLVVHGLPLALPIAIFTGLSLGVMTVALASLLRGWCGVAWVGLGTGLGYGFCNLPWVFTAAPGSQAMVAAGLAVIGLIAVPKEHAWRETKTVAPFPFHIAVAVFLALVWLDSAAFFIIQHVAEMKSATWGDALLWRNAAGHFFAALCAGILLKRGAVKPLPSLAWVLLGLAVLAVNHAPARGVAGWLYPVAVSIYSTALVAWPGWFSGADGKRKAAWRAAWLFGIAGWIGSANGIGMAESLDRVPGWFIALAGLIVVAGSYFMERRYRRVWLVAVVLLSVFLIGNRKHDDAPATAVERGRRVYLAEGCINCHSQYIRPGSADEAMWGTVDVETALSGTPVLIGNRRNGPDLSTVGARRSAAWMKAHFIDPRSFAKGSTMPSYAHLFTDGHGEDLVAYLASLGAAEMAGHMQRIAKWQPDPASVTGKGKALFAAHCAVCHGAEGRGDGVKAGLFARPPANLVQGPFPWSEDGDPAKLARIIKFGIPGTDMPGHEVLADADIAGLGEWVLGLRSR